ncbi:hypothetical protein CQW23_13458 [Capsicum baccatum]|uniref:Uncharacterized protein n=1 Tax=Capsicum baccatum TaxID=33114 RepID=A0A2G2WVP5_CAPBA|nr:hypothetical protein CQW23_13458 [Capsicum baccatum]
MSLKAEEDPNLYEDSGETRHILNDTGKLSKVMHYISNGTILVCNGENLNISHIGEGKFETQDDSDAWRKKETDLMIQKGSSHQLKSTNEDGPQIQKGASCTLSGEDYVSESQKKNEKSPQLCDVESENDTMLEITNELENATKNIETHAIENEQLIVGNEEPESLSSGYTNSDYHDCRTTAHQPLHELPNLNEKLTSTSNNLCAGPVSDLCITSELDGPPYKSNSPRAIWNPSLTWQLSSQPKFIARVGVLDSDTP